MHCAGPTATDIFTTFTFHGDGEKHNYKHVLRKFSAYCEPKQNELFETYRLLHRQRVPGEPLESWIKDLRVILKGCNFAHQHTDDRMLRDMIVLNIDDELLREKLMHKSSELTLDRCIEICCTAELTKTQARAMSSISSMPAIDAVKTKTTAGSLQPRTGQANFNCSYCGLRHPPRKCPAYGQICHNCGRHNHFVQVCQEAKLQANHIHSEDLAELASFLVSSVDYSHNKIHETLVLTHKVTMVDSRSHSHSVLCKLDTGAQVSILPLKQCQRMSLPPLQASNVNFHAFGNHIVKPLRKIKVKCRTLQDNIVYLFIYFTTILLQAVA